jgi:flavin-dependent dehydrogenase
MTASGSDLDVLILGAGPAGAALAIALCRAGVEKPLLVDRANFDRRGFDCASRQQVSFRIGESAAPGIGGLLRRLGLDDDLARRGHLPCLGTMSRWGGEAPVLKDFMIGGEGPGWHLDRSRFDAWLRAEAISAGALLRAPARLVALERRGDRWRVEIRAGEAVLALEPRWIVDATGRPAAFARRVGARLMRIDRLIAIAATTDAPGSGDPDEAGFTGFSRIEATAEGWWYAARLPDGRRLAMLMTDADLARAGGLTSTAGFRAAWAAAGIARFAPPPRRAVPPAVLDAGSRFIDRAAAPGWLALGDALIALDPLTSAGLTGALEDASAAAAALARLLMLAGGDRPGEARDIRAAYAARADGTLRRYLAERADLHGREGRWPESRFWQRRRPLPGAAFQTFPKPRWLSGPGTKLAAVSDF